eukprot:TRINITY_DN7512_c0_g1_i5.p1 TRINITY_DN7512_c0_g1~~TRINITY_DN7512_c0_g1_i5.p1  ORF type:complete len:788 (+),score=247.88 TRINITY_DN7512_c0_g1_i5:129-2492(+)
MCIRDRMRGAVGRHEDEVQAAQHSAQHMEEEQQSSSLENVFEIEDLNSFTVRRRSIDAQHRAAHEELVRRRSIDDPAQHRSVELMLDHEGQHDSDEGQHTDEGHPRSYAAAVACSPPRELGRFRVCSVTEPPAPPAEQPRSPTNTSTASPKQRGRFEVRSVDTHAAQEQPALGTQPASPKGAETPAANGQRRGRFAVKDIDGDHPCDMEAVTRSAPVTPRAACPGEVGSPPKQRGRFEVRNVDNKPTERSSTEQEQQEAALEPAAPPSERRGRFAVKDIDGELRLDLEPPSAADGLRGSENSTQSTEPAVAAAAASPPQQRGRFEVRSVERDAAGEPVPASPKEGDTPAANARRRGRFAVKDIDGELRLDLEPPSAADGLRGSENSTQSTEPAVAAAAASPPQQRGRFEVRSVERDAAGEPVPASPKEGDTPAANARRRGRFAVKDSDGEEPAAAEEEGSSSTDVAVGSPPKQRGRFEVRNVDKEVAVVPKELEVAVQAGERRGRFAVKDAGSSSRSSLAALGENSVETPVTCYPTEGELPALLHSRHTTEDGAATERRGRFAVKDLDERSMNHAQSVPNLAALHAAQETAHTAHEEPVSTKSAGGLVCQLQDFNNVSLTPEKESNEPPPTTEGGVQPAAVVGAAAAVKGPGCVPQSMGLEQAAWAGSMLEGMMAQMAALQAQNCKLLTLVQGMCCSVLCCAVLLCVLCAVLNCSYPSLCADWLAANSSKPAAAPAGSALDTLGTLQGQLQALQAKSQRLEARNVELEEENTVLRIAQKGCHDTQAS